MSAFAVINSSYNKDQFSGPLVLAESGGYVAEAGGEVAGGSGEITLESITITENGTTNAEEGTAYNKVIVNVPATTVHSVDLKAFGDATAVVYLTAIPAEDAASVDVYVPAATGLTKTTGSYAAATGVTIIDTPYARYATGDITVA